MRLPHVVDPRRSPHFPEHIEPDEYGLIAIGGELTEPILLEAYSRGIFPWYDRPPILWFSPDPRMVLYPNGFRLSRRLARLARQRRYQVLFDTDFEAVMRRCAEAPRMGQRGTWITADMVAAYTRLHERRFAHCVSVYTEGRLVGGLYGLSLGAAFFGESMFSGEPNTSKLAFRALTRWVEAKGLEFVDCQLPTPHLATLGAVEVPRSRFLAELRLALARPTLAYSWTEEGRGLAEDPLGADRAEGDAGAP